jgi:hypothetical protein
MPRTCDIINYEARPVWLSSQIACDALQERRSDAPEFKFLSVARIAAGKNVRGKAIDLEGGKHLLERSHDEKTRGR